MFTAAIFTIARMWKQPKRPLKDKWMKDLLFLHTEEHDLILEKKDILQHVATWMDPEDMLCETSPVTEREILNDSIDIRYIK